MKTSFRTIRCLLALAAIVLFLAACGGGGGSSSSSPGSSSPAEPQNVITEEPFQIAPLTVSTSSSEVTNGYLYPDQAFALPSDTISFALYLVGPKVGTTEEGLFFNGVTAPENVNFLANGDPNGYRMTDNQFCSVLLPRRPQDDITGGTWSYILQSWEPVTTEDNTLHLAIRRGTTSAVPTIRFQPYLSGASHDAADIDPALNVLEDIFTASGMTAEVAAPKSLSSSATVIPSNFNDPETAALVQQGDEDTVNLFFIDDFSDGAFLGIAAGIPGTMGLSGRFNGVLISTDAHSVHNTLNTQMLGETAAHEALHFLGLYHTSEWDGLLHDPIDDTPECDASHDGADLLSHVDADECIGAGAENLMFWQADNGIDQSSLSEGQVDVIRRSLLAQ